MKEIIVGLSKCRMLPIGQTTDAWDVLSVQNLIYEPLVRARNGRIFPALAQSWQIFDNGRKWIFSLRPDITFHDGSVCTMEDVVRSFEEMRNARDSFGMPGPFSRYLSGLEFNILNSNTLEVLSEYPNGDIADFLSEIFIRKFDHNTEQLIGTGPYELSNYEPNQKIILQKQKKYSSDLMYQKIEFRIIPDAEDRYEMLKTGQIHLAMNLDQLKDRPEENPDFKWHKSINTLSVIGFLNGFEAPFNNPEARLAINLAVDVKGLIHEVLHDLAVPASTVVSPFHCGFESTLQPIPYDPDRAKAIFSKVDLPSELVFRTPTFMPDRAVETSTYIVEQLSKIGLPAKIDIMKDRPEYAREVGAKKTGHIALFDSSPHSSYRILSDKISSEQKGLWWQGIKDEKMDSLIREAHAEYDVLPRERCYANALQYLNQNPYWLYLYHPIFVNANRPEVDDIELTHEGLLRFPGTW